MIDLVRILVLAFKIICRDYLVFVPLLYLILNSHNLTWSERSRRHTVKLSHFIENQLADYKYTSFYSLQSADYERRTTPETILCQLHLK